MTDLPSPARRSALFVVTILTGSFLLFLVQPMIARIALPRLGGAPAVWNSAQLVYQALLLGGYAYAHLLTRLAPRTQGIVHLVVLLVAATLLPIGLSDRVLPAGAEPAVWVPYLFAISIGPLFFAVSAQAPLVQRWFSVSRPGADPYPLYAASNLGSFVGLLAFPLVVEPLLPVTDQRWLWSAGYVLLIALVAACVWQLPRAHAAVADVAREAPPRRQRIALWIALGFVPSGLMLATSTYIATDLVAMPLLWVIPLALYLLSFSVAFATRRGLADAITRFAPVTVVVFGGIMMGGVQGTPLFSVGIALIVMFMVAVALHTRLYRLRPEPARLTGFYLAMSFGGALGGVFTGLIAPVVFDWTWEYPILILLAGLLVPLAYLTPAIARVWTNPSSRTAAFAAAVTVLAGLLLTLTYLPNALEPGKYMVASFVVVAGLGILTVGARRPFVVVLAFALMLFGGMRSLMLSFEPGARTRSYFGVYTVNQNALRRTLVNGTTIHGLELLGSPAKERAFTTYYTERTGVGRVMTAIPALFGADARVGVVGLGAGTLACYRQPGQQWRFYEIDPAIVALARHSFSFLSHCAPGVPVDVGDARLTLDREPTRSLDVLTLDAFSSDAIPMHLLTREAFAGYARVLRPNGVLVVHISNRYFDLAPVVAAAAKAGGWRAAILNHTPRKTEVWDTKSTWVVLTRDEATYRAITMRGDWQPLAARPGFAPWTDDYSSILPLLKF